MSEFGIGLPPTAPQKKKSFATEYPERKATKEFVCRVCGLAMDNQAIKMRPTHGYICTTDRRINQNKAKRSPEAEATRQLYAKIRSRNRTQEELRKDHLRGFAKKLRLKFGMELPDFDELMLKQDGKCAICKREPDEKRLSIDHCHATGKVRGLLCHNCNVGLGSFKDDTSRLEKAISYLKGEPC